MRKKYYQKDLITEVSEKTGYHEYNVSEMLVALEEVINDLLLTADETKDIEIRLMPGIGLFSFFIPSHNKRMPDGNIKKTKDSIHFSARFTDNFTRTRRRMFEEAYELWKRVQRRKGK